MNKRFVLFIFLFAISLTSLNACCGGGDGGGSCCGGGGTGQPTTPLYGSEYSYCGCNKGCGGDQNCKSLCGCTEPDGEEGDSCCDGENGECSGEEGEDGTCGGEGGSCSCCGGSHGVNEHDQRLGDNYWNKVNGAPFELTGKVRYYYIAAEEVVWDYAPKGFNGITGKPYTPAEEVFTTKGPGRIGSKYVKCLYREYTSSSFKTLRPRTEHEEHLGFMGPTIYGEVGDIIKIVFYNKCKFKATVHPHGVFYNKDGEGAPYEDGTSGYDKNDDGVPQGKKHTYVWWVPPRAGPGIHDGSSVMWMYHSHHHEVTDFYAGLIGNMIITRKGMLGYRKPRDVDKEVFWMYAIMDENQSEYIDESIKKFVDRPYNITELKANGAFRNSNSKFSINGYIFGNAPTLKLIKGERVRYYLMSMGGGRDVHTPHWHGNMVHLDGMRVNTAGLLAAEMVTADQVPDAVGTWLHHCHVNEHLANGMTTPYEVIDY